METENLQKEKADTFKDWAISTRVSLKKEAGRVKEVISGIKKTETNGTEDRGEMIANLMLSYRHLEDAAMRVGKAIQAHEGGISVYDQKMPERDLNKEA